jgi:hypothetical protein
VEQGADKRQGEVGKEKNAEERTQKKERRRRTQANYAKAQQVESRRLEAAPEVLPFGEDLYVAPVSAVWA